jgi:phosphoglycerol transferase MdoB-like AlkP superfamily enzyme
LKQIKKTIYPLLIHVTLFVVFFSALRLMFFLFNINHFQLSSISETLQLVYQGFTLDLLAIFFLTLILFPLRIFKRTNQVYLALSSVFFVLVAIFSLINSLFFRYSKELLGLELFENVQAENNISAFIYLSEYWEYLIPTSFFLVFFIWLFRVKSRIPVVVKRSFILSNLLLLAIIYVFVRGGFTSRPKRTVDVVRSIAPKFMPLAANLPLFAFEKWQNPLTPPTFLSNTQIARTHAKSFVTSDSFPRKHYNIIVIILESFGKEYTSLNNGFAVSYTPFLDSLMSQSLVCNHAFSNGLKSMDAIPAIFCGIPRLSKTPYIHTPQSAKATPSIFSELKKLGYNTSFFHGADAETMGFQSFLKGQGLDEYYSINDVQKNKKNNDGAWGVYDEPFFDFFSKTLNKTTEPFVSGIFTLSSHHPYSIPAKYKNTFPKGSLPIHESIGYTDHSLRIFFDQCKDQPWFQNTIFVITADHSSENALHNYRTASGKYEIPLLFYAPEILNANQVSKTVSHLDILPSVLDFVGYKDSVRCNGESIRSGTNQNGVVHIDQQIYHYTKDDWTFGRSEDVALFLYNTRQDPNCLNNLIEEKPAWKDSMNAQLKRVLGNYFGNLP